MKAKILFIMCLFFNLLGAQIHPTPQEQHFLKKSIKPPLSFNYKTEYSIAQNNAIRNLLEQEFKKSKNGFKLIIGFKDGLLAKNYQYKIPNKEEAYYLNIQKNKIILIGSDSRGVYYGLQTLKQLIKKNRLPLGEIIDYPDVAFRGVVEGFYGTPWSFEDRMRQLDFYGENKLNTYIYGPKDDPYHSTPNWRKPYPKKEAQQIKTLVERSKKNEVDFYWAIHPGKDIQWNEQDRAALLQKFEAMYALGVRAFAVFFDDISGEGTKAEKQAELLNYIDNQFIQVKKDIRPLIMCPTEYNKSWSNIQGGYLPTLGKKLNKDIHIMWTGDKVIADVTPTALDWVNKTIQRKAFFWWNFPVSDYVRDHLLLGPAYGLDNSVENKIDGMVSNPMERAEASKVAIFSVADYAWNIKTYDYTEAWKRAIKKIFPKDAEAYQFFSEHNADLGKNGHGYRRDESWSFKPLAERLKAGVANNNLPQADFNNAINFFEKMISSVQILKKSEDNPYLIKEIKPWLTQFELLGKTGKETLMMISALKNRKEEDFRKRYTSFLTYKEQMYSIDHTFNQNPYQPGVKTGSLVITPLVDTLFSSITKQFNKIYSANLKTEANYNPHKIYTNIAQLKNQPLRLDNRKVNITPVLEIVKIAPKEYIGIELQNPTHVKQITINLENNAIESLGEMQYSIDGKHWTKIEGKYNNNLWWNHLNKKAKYLRFINNSEKPIEVYFKKFEIKVS